ncbi:hypothetical protein CN422_17965 [Bacillus cereus]|uniref:insecticidal delta-endotoxin Cry8Ea1 family protein n=1 Tax=Bacillus cereus TaxID=1396 RepID=UPI000BF43A95|nr:insecticidal delta-endotoxin Cry8Ea1 family protein [Bacillus cereus]PEV57419.1 hypothetical protein CN422_17965 [Bacillus cereus]
MEHIDKNVNKAQQATTNSLGGGGGATAPNLADANRIVLEKIIEKLKDKKIFEGNKYLTADAMKAVNSLGGTALKQIYTNAYSTDFNNASRELAMGITALIPYAGVIISPLLGLIWPENTSDSQMKQVEKMIQEEIKTYDISTIQSSYKTLLDFQKKFEYSMIEKGIKKSTRKTNAINADNKFVELIHASSKDEKLEEAELPIYTITATSHLAFLKSMQLDEVQTDAGIDKGTFNSNFNNLKEKTTEYTKHIKDTYNKKHKDVIKKIEDIGKKYKLSEIDATNYEEVLKKKQKELNGYIRSVGDRNGTLSYKVTQIDKDIETCDKLSIELKNYYNQTWGNTAFQMLAVGAWKKVNDKWSFIDSNGQRKTGWLEIGSNWYYLSPADDTKNYKGEIFKKGEMMTGRVEIDGKWYYFNSKTGEMEDPNSGSIVGTYKIVSKSAPSMVLNTTQHSTVLKGINEDTWGNDWTFHYDKSKKAYMITNRQGNHPGILTCNWGSKNHSFVFITDDTAEKPEHYWTLEPAEDGYYFFHNYELPGKVLDITGNNTAAETKIDLFDKNGQDNQKFRLEKIN